jgi:hypothetical protein
MKHIQLAHNIIFYIALSAVFLFLAFLFFLAANNMMPSFDGAMNYQVPLNLLKNGLYATSYDSLKIFGHEIQSGGPFLFLITIFFFFFGISSFVAQSVNVIFVLGVALLIFLLTTRITKQPWFGLLSVIFFLFTPRIFEFGLGGYGELPSLFFVLLSVYILFNDNFLRGKRILAYTLAGFSFGLAYLTKTVVLLFLPVFVIFVLYDVFFESRKSSRKWIGFFAGIFLPILLFEFYKFSQLGFGAYLDWWGDEMEGIYSESGAKSSSSFSNLSIFYNRFISRFSTLAHSFSISVSALICFFISPLVSLMCFWKKLHKRVKKLFLFLLLSAFLYFLWWFLVASDDRVWFRRIINVVIIYESLIIVSLCFCIRSFFQFLKKIKVRLLIINFVVFLSLLFAVGAVIISNFYNINPLDEISPRLQASQSAGLFLKTLTQDSEVYGYGWWQAPVLSFLGSRHVNNLEPVLQMNDLKDHSSTKRMFLLVDHFFYHLDRKTLDRLLSQLKHKLVFRQRDVFVYELMR